MTSNTEVQSTEGISLIQRKRMTPSQGPSHLLLLLHLSVSYATGKRDTNTHSDTLTDPGNIHMRDEVVLKKCLELNDVLKENMTFNIRETVGVN